MKNRLPSCSAMLLSAAIVAAQDTTNPATTPASGLRDTIDVPAAAPASGAALPALPAPLSVPAPGPANDAPYAPQPILQGGVVVALYPPGSPFLKMERVREAEQYNMSRAVPGRISSIVNIHNPSIEVHTVDGSLNTGAAVILAAGGGHKTLNVGTEAADFVPWFFNYGVNTVILRNRLRRDGYDPKSDAVNDALQAIRLVRAHAKEWKIDPNRIGIMGFSAGAELAAPAAVFFEDFDKKNSAPGDPLAGISSRPDFAGIVYPGPTPFSRGGKPPIPRNTPPAFITCAGSGDRVHALWANEYFAAMLQAGIPNMEMHIYGNGRHPGDALSDGSHMTGGLTHRNGIPFGTWHDRFVDWFRDLGFLQKPGTETKAAQDVRTFVSQPQRDGGGGVTNEKAALQSFKAATMAMKEWADKNKPNPADPTSGIALIGKMADKMKAIKTAGLPADLKAAWAKMLVAIGKLQDACKEFPTDEKKFMKFMTERATADPDFGTKFQAKMETIGKEVEAAGNGLKELGKKYGIDLDMEPGK